MAGTLFEVHTLKSGSWQIDSTHRDRDAALDVARSLYGEKRFDAVKVIKDVFDPATNASKEIVIYDTAKGGEKKGPPPPPASKSAPPPPAPKKDVDFGTPSQAPARPSDSRVFLRSMLWLTAILFAGLLVIWALFHFSAILARIGIIR